MLTKNHNQLVIKVARHVAADAVIQGMTQTARAALYAIIVAVLAAQVEKRK